MFVKYTLTVEAPRGGGLVVSALDSGSSGLGSSPGWGLRQDTSLSQCLSPPRDL